MRYRKCGIDGRKKDLIMGQIHKKFTTEQVKVLLAAYEGRHISREEIQRTLEVQKTRFFALLKKYREGEAKFTLEYHRAAKGRLAAEMEEKIRGMLLEEKGLFEKDYHLG